MQAGLATPFPLPRVVDDDAAKGGNASLRFGLPLLAPATRGFDRISVEQPFDIDRFTFGSGTILAGTGPDTAVLGIELALPRHAVRRSRHAAWTSRSVSGTAGPSSAWHCRTRCPESDRWSCSAPACSGST